MHIAYVLAANTKNTMILEKRDSYVQHHAKSTKDGF